MYRYTNYVCSLIFLSPFFLNPLVSFLSSITPIYDFRKNYATPISTGRMTR